MSKKIFDKICSCSIFFYFSELTDAAYEEVSEETLDALTEKFEDLGEEKYTSDNFDVNYAVCI